VSKLDQLSVPMERPQVEAAMGKPDRILRDDGRVQVWEYKLAARNQWLYELGLCPVAVLMGGCLFYPFTNTATEHHREYPYHVVLVNDRLCAWGAPLSILQKRKVCTGSGAFAEHDDPPMMRVGGVSPVVVANGPISRETVGQYQTMAVMTFADAPGVPGSGSRVSGMVTTLLLDLDVTIVERTRLEQVLNEQVVRLQHGDDADALKVGKLVGANAIVVGEVGQWESQNADKGAHVSLVLRMIDVESGQVLFSGEGQVTDPSRDEPENLTRLVAHRILGRFGTRTGLLASGRIGVNWELRELGGAKAYYVRDVVGGSPAERVGLHQGDVVLACQGRSLTNVHSEREAKQLCQVEAGQQLALEVRRGEERLVISPQAEARPGL
jgi:hypothetical protein